MRATRLRILLAVLIIFLILPFIWDFKYSRFQNFNPNPIHTVPPPESYSGYFFDDDSGVIFKMEPTGQYFILIGNIGGLVEKYAEMTYIPSEPLYVEFTGYPLESTVYSSYWDGEMSQINISQVVVTDYISRDMRVFPLDFKCYGNEPFWSIDVLSGDEIIFKDLSKDRVLYIPYTEPIIDNGSWTYELTHDGRNVPLWIEEKECIDSMSGERYEYTATFVIDGETYTGCAEKIDF